MPASAWCPQAREMIKGLPTVIQSSDIKNSRRAFELKSTFINKNSETLLQDIRNFIMHHLGFGNFVYRDSGGKKDCRGQVAEGV